MLSSRCCLILTLALGWLGRVTLALGAPVNDDVVQATFLTLGQATAFNNSTATVQTGEVTPGAGSGLSCRAQDGWCQNLTTPTHTLWYSVTATADPLAVFVQQAPTANLQLALWQADDPGNFATFRKIAANDDGNDHYAPGILPVAGLTAGGNYLIQLSGQPGFFGGGGLIQTSAVTMRPLASGQLGAGNIGLFKFSLESAINATDYFVINTSGSTFNTELGLYDSAGRLVAENDNISSGNLSSELRFGFAGTHGAALSAGEYTLALGGFNTIFRDGELDTSFNQQGSFQLNIQSTQTVITPLGPSWTAIDGNILPVTIQEVPIAQGFLEEGEVLFFPISIDGDIDENGWAVIHTTGSAIDTEIALYDANGHLVAQNDNISSYNLRSRLSFGFDGDDGEGLPAGDYTLVVGGANTIFREGLDVTSGSHWTGEYALYLQTSASVSLMSVPEPAHVQLMGTGLALLGARFWMRRRR